MSKASSSRIRCSSARKASARSRARPRPARATNAARPSRRCSTQATPRRPLARCLAIQLRDRDRLDPAMQVLVANLELLAKRDGAKLMALCGINAEDLGDMVAEIKALNPKPGLIFDGVVAQTVVPDVMM